MELTEHVAAYLRGNGFPAAASGAMPLAPDRTAAVYATGVRPGGDEEGSRFQVVVRSEADADTALADAMAVIDLLDDFEGLLSADSPYVARIALEGGASSLGADAGGRLRYGANFRAWIC